jgi:uncharacterized protein YggE
MMNLRQNIEHPFGVTVFGSAIVRVEPDIASMNFSISRLAQTPKDAFQEARTAAKGVSDFLARAGMTDSGTSRVTLTQSFAYENNKSRFIGYTAKVVFHVLLRDLDRMEEIISGVVDAGANEIQSIDLQTSRLKEIRAEARRRAVEAAREKAENYCKAAGVTLGPVIHLEDVSPDVMRLEAMRGGHGSGAKELDPDDSGAIHAFNPGSITVAAAVMLSFEIGR